MAPHSLHPAYVQIDYTSAYAPHKAIIPTTDWFPTSITGTLGSYQGWNSTPVDAEVMINALVDAIAALHLATTHFDLATVFTIADELAPIAIPRATAALTQVGGTGSAAQAKAVQQVLMFRTQEAFKLKIYLLDAPLIGSDFEKISRGSWGALEIAIETALKADGNAWAGRDGAQVVTGSNITKTMNEKLRREYRMT